MFGSTYIGEEGFANYKDAIKKSTLHGRSVKLLAVAAFGADVTVCLHWVLTENSGGLKDSRGSAGGCMLLRVGMRG